MIFNKLGCTSPLGRDGYLSVLEYNRFAKCPLWLARLFLFLLVFLMALAARSPLPTDQKAQGRERGEQLGRAVDDHDLILYDRIIDGLRNGNGYYQAAVAEHRAGGYPLRPSLTVRLPTLAKLLSLLPEPENPAQRGKAERVIAVVLFSAILIGWQRRLSEELDSTPLRLFGLVLLAIGSYIGTVKYYLVLHEIWAGALIALSLAYYRPNKGKWILSYLAAGAALAIRELALPFVILMAVQAFWYRRWQEACAWIGLILLFAAGLTLHFLTLAAHVSPQDLEGLPWLTWRGFKGWMSMIVNSSPLSHLPSSLAGPLVVLMVFGWAGWRTQIGALCALLFLGYGVAFMIAGRENNWYWGFTIAPTMWLGLAFVPMTIRGLLQASLKKSSS